MSNMVVVDFDNLPEPRRGQPLADRRVEGDVRFTTWDIDRSADGTVTSGIWEATPGAYWCVKGDSWEFCSILSGLSELTEEGGTETRRLRPGDTFVLRPGFKGIWRVIETTRKLWVQKD